MYFSVELRDFGVGVERALVISGDLGFLHFHTEVREMFGKFLLRGKFRGEIIHFQCKIGDFDLIFIEILNSNLTISSCLCLR